MSKKKRKKTRAEKLAKVAEAVMRDKFDGFMELVEKSAKKGESSVECSAFSYSDGQIATLFRMFKREGFTVLMNLGGTFTIKW